MSVELQDVATSCRSYRSQWSAASPVARTQGLRPRALRLALEFIERHLGERFTLAALAASAGVSRFHFARLFRITTGHSPMEYLMRTRIERSTAILLQGDCSVCEVAALLGFCDQSHFTRTFRRVIGASPREFVRNSRLPAIQAMPTASRGGPPA